MYIGYRAKEKAISFLKNQNISMSNVIEIGAAVYSWNRHKLIVTFEFITLGRKTLV